SSKPAKNQAHDAGLEALARRIPARRLAASRGNSCMPLCVDACKRPYRMRPHSQDTSPDQGRNVSMWIERTAVAAAIALAMSGCATLRDNPTACKVGATLIGATLGAVGGGVGVDQIEKGPDDGEIAAGAAAGLVAGGLIGYLIGHYACPE